MAEEKKEELNDEFISPEDETEDPKDQIVDDEVDKKILAAKEAAATVAEASEIIKSQEESYANRRAEEESRWEEQEKKRVESGEQSTKRLEALASTVLDAAEVANRSASAVTNSHRSLTMGAKSLISAASNGNVRSTIVVSLAVALLLGTAGLFSLVMYQMNKKIEQIDLMIVNLGTRSAEVKNSLTTIEDLTKNINDINSNFNQLKKVNTTLSASIEALNTGSEQSKEEQTKLLTEQASNINKESLKIVEKMVASVKELEKSLESKIKSQEKSINEQRKTTGSLARELKNFEKTISKNLKNALDKTERLNLTALELAKVKREIEALIILQEKQYLDALKAAEPRQKNNQMIKYPAKVSSLSPEEKK